MNGAVECMYFGALNVCPECTKCQAQGRQGSLRAAHECKKVGMFFYRAPYKCIRAFRVPLGYPEGTLMHCALALCTVKKHIFVRLVSAVSR